MRLTVETGPLAGTVLTLERDRPATIGSAPDCDLQIREAGVAEQHAVVKALKGEGFGIKALGIVLVNGAEVQASPLADGDVIKVGTTRIAYGDVQEQGLPQIPGYRILGVLGKGGMGTVYRAEQVSLSRQVALKVLNHEQTQDASFVGKFVAEAQAAAKLHHPHVVSVFDVEHDGDTYYYAMELMQDGSCEDWLRQNGTMPVDRALQVIADAAAGLAYAESLGIVHRDIKPDNLMLDQHGAIKIADLGLASTAAEIPEERAIGTPHFMAPEQVLNKNVDHRTDLYALGCTFYRLVTGRTPFRGKSVKDILRAQVKDDPESASKVNPEVPPEVSAIIQRLMEKDADDRYQTANELLEELEVMLRPAQKRGMWIGLAAAAVLVAGGAIYWAVTKPKETEVIIREKVYDDPEKQEFADRIERLEAEAVQKDAQIALLSARVSGREGEQLALELDRVAGEFPDTVAAESATRLATSIREAVAEERRQLEQRRERIASHVADVRRATIEPVDQGDFARAIAALGAAPPATIADDEELLAGIARVRDEILGKARKRLEQLTGAVGSARDAGQEQQLETALGELRTALEAEARWPAALAAEVTAAKTLATGADTALAELRQQRRQDVWRSYAELVGGQEGVGQRLATLDFPTASTRLREFAGATEFELAAQRATSVAVLSDAADRFATALAEACGRGELTLTLGDVGLTMQAWDRDKREFTVERDDRRRNRTDTISADQLGVDDWRRLATQVPDVDTGDRVAFLTLVALQAHAAAARDYLARLQPSDDQSGTGEQGYPFSPVVFDELLQHVPTDEQPWLTTLRGELAAGLRLASGLRALTEHRNLAAAGHIEKLLTDHPHSIAVALLL